MPFAHGSPQKTYVVGPKISSHAFFQTFLDVGKFATLFEIFKVGVAHPHSEISTEVSVHNSVPLLSAWATDTVEWAKLGLTLLVSRRKASNTSTRVQETGQGVAKKKQIF